MSIYTYKRDDLIELLEVAGSIGNLAANLGVCYQTVARLLATDKAYPTRKTINKIKPYALGFLEIEQKTRPYKKRDSANHNAEPQP